MKRIALLLLAASLATAEEVVGTQGAPGSVAGSVHDSTRGGPLVDAAVFLWGTPHRTVSDAAGRFVLDSIPPGEYDVVFFHPRLGRLGLSPGPVPARVRSGHRTSVALATPSMRTVLAGLCVLEAGDEVAATVGRVSDAGSGVALPGATVRASWEVDGDGGQRTRETRADEAGWYRVCALPFDVTVDVVAEFVGRASARREVRLEEREVRPLDIAVGDTAGAVIPLDPLTVTVEGSRIEGRAVGGTLITRSEIDRVRDQARDLGELFRRLQLPGIVVHRRSEGLCIGLMQGQARMMGRGDCVPALVYIDDVRATSPEVAASLPIDVIDRIIMVRPVDAGNLFGMGSGSGALLIYTRQR